MFGMFRVAAALTALLLVTGAQADSEVLMPTYHQPLSGYYFKVLGLGEPIRSRSLWDGDLDIQPLVVGEQAHWRTAGPAGQHLLVRAAGYQLGDRNITVAVAEPVAQRRAAAPKDQTLR